MESAKSVMEPVMWILQMSTGLAMIALVSTHFYVTHMISHDALEYSAVIERVSSTEYRLLYGVLLLIVSFHAFNGLRAIILDTNAGMKVKNAINVLTTLMFLTAFFYGIYLLVNI